MDGPLRLVHAISKNRLRTGSVVQAMDAARGLARRGHQVTVVSRPGGDLEAACSAAGVAFLPLPLRHHVDVGSALAWRRRLAREPADVIHVHKGRAHWLALAAAAGAGPRPVLVVNRGVTFPLDLLNRWKYRHPRVAAVVCVADAVRDVVLASGGLAPELLRVIPAGTDTERFHPDRIDSTVVRRELRIGPDAVLVGQVSVRGWKGWRDLVAAFARLAPERPRARLLLVGCENEKRRREILATADGLGVGERIHLLGYRSDMPEVLAACDVVADASVAGTGITGTVREAMALARSVVATDCGGNRELVVDGRVGLVVPPGNVPALASALGRLVADAALRARLGTAARQRVVERFSLERRLDALEELYREVAAAAASR